mmetsp:Transcript_18400/g.53197  ORF Transcript_18400/g.53197 Transcript_18400/m.53197 type:complete len:433 (-) Transcript_18400:1785-3083(-)
MASATAIWAAHFARWGLALVGVYALLQISVPEDLEALLRARTQLHEGLAVLPRPMHQRRIGEAVPCPGDVEPGNHCKQSGIIAHRLVAQPLPRHGNVIQVRGHTPELDPEDVALPSWKAPRVAPILVRQRGGRVAGGSRGSSIQRTDDLAPIPVTKHLKVVLARRSHLELQGESGGVALTARHRLRLVVPPRADDMVISKVRASGRPVARHELPLNGPPLAADLKANAVDIARPRRASNAKHVVGQPVTSIRPLSGKIVVGLRLEGGDAGRRAAVQQPTFASQHRRGAGDDGASGRPEVLGVEDPVAIAVKQDLEPLPPVHAQRHLASPCTGAIPLHLGGTPTVPSARNAVAALGNLRRRQLAATLRPEEDATPWQRRLRRHAVVNASPGGHILLGRHGVAPDDGVAVRPDTTPVCDAGVGALEAVSEEFGP